ncbi:cell cycle control protein 50C-like isoform X3 [Heliangelus exortis]|uniref:cell cycle control protein 50C-like isoform X3 n=1 Tax=Heliangelus exortis TaxID=472823 RepID=UPI003A8D3FF6
MKNKTSFLPQEGETHPSRCPDNSAFKQQKLPAWKPQLTLATVLSTFFLTGALCLSVGVCLILSANSVREIQIDYSDRCSDCSKLRENTSNWNKECYCFVNFTLKEDILGDVFMYYGLQNFYQNHRRYMVSRSDAQLLGQNVNIQKSYCAPFTTYQNGTPMAPCGAIANSMFNDTIDLFYNINSSVVQVPLLKTGNSWWTDKNVKFRNPKSYNVSSAFAASWEDSIHSSACGPDPEFRCQPESVCSCLQLPTAADPRSPAWTFPGLPCSLAGDVRGIGGKGKEFGINFPVYL